MKALVFGSIGSVAETSELQRQAFNAAFVAHGLTWHWDRTTYRTMLIRSGGKDRVADYAEQMRTTVNAVDIHATKTQIFADMLRSHPVIPRKGVIESLQLAKERGIKTAFASTTAATTIRSILESQEGALARLFEIVTTADDTFPQKPAPDIYLALCKRFDIAPAEALVVEDNAAGLQAAHTAGTHVLAFLGTNTQHHSTAHADGTAGDDIFPAVRRALTAPERKAG